MSPIRAADPSVRLPFEPKDWLVEYRAELHNALRTMNAPGESVLYAEYAAPEPAFVDLENVLLYNVGSGCYSHLARNGVVCRRTVSHAGLHHVTYANRNASEVLGPGGTVLARGRLASMPTRSTPTHWWACFREHLEADGSETFNGQFGIVAEAGTSWRRGLAPSVKSLLDGLVAALHVHDRSHREQIVAALNEVGDGERLWDLLNNPRIAVLGERQLVRLHRANIAWNPADERCDYFALVRSARQEAPTLSIVAM